MEIVKEEKKEEKAITVLPTINETVKRPEPFSANLRTDKENVSERAKKLVALAMLSPRHGKHGRLKKTIAKEEVFKEIQRKLLERSFKLINTQTVLAHGSFKVFKIKSEWVGVGKKRWLKKGKPELVKNEHEIASIINWEYGERNEDENPNSDTEFFFITTERPDHNAIKNQIDRIFGPVTQKINLTLNEKEVLPITGMEIIHESNKDATPN